MELKRLLTRATTLLFRGAYQGAESFIEQAMEEADKLKSELSELDTLRTRVTEMASEVERLQSVIDEANAQEPFAYCYTDVNGRAKELCEPPECQIPQDKRVITALYCSPIPAQQSYDQALQLLAESRESYEKQFGFSSDADWVYNDLAELFIVDLPEQQSPDPRGTNEYGLDIGYMAGKLNLFMRDIDRHTPDEAARVLARLAMVADQSVLHEPEFSERIRAGMWLELKAQQSPAVAAPLGYVQKHHYDSAKGGKLKGQAIVNPDITGRELVELVPVYWNPPPPPPPSPRITEQDKMSGEEVYLFRRKGLDPFLTCSRERFYELSRNDSFETKILYENALVSAPFPHPRISEDELKIITKKYYDWCNSEVIFNRRTMLETWVNDEGRALLNKLNGDQNGK